MATFRPAVEGYRELIQRLAPDLPIDFVLAAINHESGGNECALGIPGVEAGIMQTYHPTDDIFGATFNQLRVTCSGQTPIRPMTPAEKQLQAQVAVNAIRAFRDRARQRLAAVGANWGEGSVDFWNFVKLGHGLPAMQTDLLRQITSSLGRPPRDWNEFRSIVLAMSPAQFPASLQRFAAAPSVRGLQNRIADVILNAEVAGKHGGGFIATLANNPVAAALLVTSAAALFVIMWRRRVR